LGLEWKRVGAYGVSGDEGHDKLVRERGREERERSDDGDRYWGIKRFARFIWKLILEMVVCF